MTDSIIEADLAKAGMARRLVAQRTDPFIPQSRSTLPRNTVADFQFAGKLPSDGVLISESRREVGDAEDAPTAAPLLIIHLTDRQRPKNPPG